jgi:hypothetical protein
MEIYEILVKRGEQNQQGFTPLFLWRFRYWHEVSSKKAQRAYQESINTNDEN